MTPSFRERVREILTEFAKTFAEEPHPGNIFQKKGGFGWWGHDTDLGDCEESFNKALAEILSLVRGIIPEKRDLSASYDSYDADYEWNLCREYILNEMGEGDATRKHDGGL